MNEKKDIFTPEEHEVMELISEAWNKFQKLPVQHYRDKTEFLSAIHAAQHIIMIRPVMRYEDTTGRLEAPDWDQER
jgi:hypothetical protein